MITTLLMTAALALPGDDASWDHLAGGKTVVECTTHDGQPWCRSTAVFQAPVATLNETLQHMDKHSDKFESILKLDVVEEGVLHVVMDFPPPLADRDYVAVYSREEQADGTIVIRWTPADASKAPATDENVRLERFAGSWTLVPNGESTTVTYLWQGEYGGSLPSWTLNAARKKTGAEAIKDLAGAAGGVTYSAP